MKCTLVVDFERIKTVPYNVDDHHSLSSSSSETLEIHAFLLSGWAAVMRCNQLIGVRRQLS